MKDRSLNIIIHLAICVILISCNTSEQESFKKGNYFFKNRDYYLAIQKYTEALRNNKNDYRIYFNRSLAWKNIDELDHALEDLNKVIELKPEFASSYLERGLIWNKKGFKDLELSEYNKAIKLNPNLFKVYHNRAILKEENREYESAFLDYCKAIEINPNYFPSLINRASIYRKQKKYDLAILDYNKALNKNTKFAEGFFLRGKLYYEIGNIEKAHKDLSRAILLNPENDKFFLFRGNIWYSECNIKKVIEDYSAAIKINSSDANVYNELAWIFATEADEIYRNRTKAIEYAKKAIELEPNFKNFDTLSAAYAENGKFEEAIKTQVRAINLCKEQNDPTLIVELTKRINNYKHQQPWREICKSKGRPISR